MKLFSNHPEVVVAANTADELRFFLASFCLSGCCKIQRMKSAFFLASFCLSGCCKIQRMKSAFFTYVLGEFFVHRIFSIQRYYGSAFMLTMSLKRFPKNDLLSETSLSFSLKAIIQETTCTYLETPFEWQETCFKCTIFSFGFQHWMVAIKEELQFAFNLWIVQLNCARVYYCRPSLFITRQTLSAKPQK